MAKDKANAWAMEQDHIKLNVDGKVDKIQKNTSLPSSGKLDTKRLEYFSDVDSLHSLLKHPLLSAFLEMELNSLKIRYFFDFFFFLLFVIVLFTHLGNKYGVFNVDLTEGDGVVFTIPNFGGITYYTLILFIFIMEPNTKMTTQNVSILFIIVHPFVLVIEGHLFFGANTICNSQFLTAVTVK